MAQAIAVGAMASRGAASPLEMGVHQSQSQLNVQQVQPPQVQPPQIQPPQVQPLQPLQQPPQQPPQMPPQKLQQKPQQKPHQKPQQKLHLQQQQKKQRELQCERSNATVSGLPSQVVSSSVPTDHEQLSKEDANITTRSVSVQAMLPEVLSMAWDPERHLHLLQLLEMGSMKERSALVEQLVG